MLQADRDVRRLPLEVVNMCAPLSWPEEVRNGGDGVRFAIAGYLQSWSTLGSWVEVVERQLERPGMSLDLLVPWHWGGRAERSHESRSDLDRLDRYESVTTHGPMTFSEFQGFLSKVDVSIDLFQHNLEREYAMVTRSVIALACGVPVIHPTFTEVSPMITEYDAGWLVDPLDTAALEAVIGGILDEPDMVLRKKRNARELASALLDPAVAVKPLLRIMEAW
jgi:glycosyltransferase involved in cell wall biosynthesis